LKNTDSVKLIFPELGFMTVYALYVNEVIRYVVDNNELSISKHNYKTHQKVTLEQHKLECFKKKTTYMGNKFFIGLPVDLKSKVNSKTFKKDLKQYLVNRPIYSLQEFFEHS